MEMGAFAATCSIIMTAFCTFMTSVVMRVTRLLVENLSMFAKEKSWMRLNIPSLRFRESPAAARVELRPATVPSTRHNSAKSSSRRPRWCSSPCRRPKARR